MIQAVEMKITNSRHKKLGFAKRKGSQRYITLHVFGDLPDDTLARNRNKLPSKGNIIGISDRYHKGLTA